MYEQKISFKGDGDKIYVNGAKGLHLSSTAGTTTLSPFSPYAYLLMPTMRNFSW